MHHIASGMNFNQEEWGKIQQKGWKELQKNIEGEFSREQFFECFKFDEKLPKDFVGKFKEWSADLTSEEMKHFLAYSTGSPTIPNKKIGFHVIESGELEVHSCGGYADVPLKKLKKFVEDINKEDIANGGKGDMTVTSFIINYLDGLAKEKGEMKFNIA